MKDGLIARKARAMLPALEYEVQVNQDVARTGLFENSDRKSTASKPVVA